MKGKETKKYLLRTTSDFFLEKVKMQGNFLEMSTLEDFCGETGVWVKVPKDCIFTARRCSRCFEKDMRPAKYCKFCGSRNTEGKSDYERIHFDASLFMQRYQDKTALSFEKLFTGMDLDNLTYENLAEIAIFAGANIDHILDEYCVITFGAI